MRLSEISQIRTNIVCADGFRISYQASEGHYCEPKVNEWNDKFSLIQNKDRDGQEIELMEIEGEGKGEEWQMKDPRCTVEYSVVEVMMRDYDEYLEEYLEPYLCSCSKCPGGHKGDMSAPFMLPAHVAIFILIKHGGAVQGHIPPFSNESHANAVQLWKKWKDDADEGRIRTVDYAIAVSWFNKDMEEWKQEGKSHRKIKRSD